MFLFKVVEFLAWHLMFNVSFRNIWKHGVCFLIETRMIAVIQALAWAFAWLRLNYSMSNNLCIWKLFSRQPFFTLQLLYAEHAVSMPHTSHIHKLTVFSLSTTCYCYCIWRRESIEGKKSTLFSCQFCNQLGQCYIIWGQKGKITKLIPLVPNLCF